MVLARENGFLAIHVEPFDVSRDNIVVRMTRVFEKKLVEFVLRKQKAKD